MWRSRVVAVLAGAVVAVTVALAIGWIAEPGDRPTPDRIRLGPGGDPSSIERPGGIEVVPPPVRLDPTTTTTTRTAPPPPPAPPLTPPPAPAPAPAPAPPPPPPAPLGDDDDDDDFEPDDDDDFEPDDDDDEWDDD